MNNETLDYRKIFQEYRGALCEGNLKLYNEKVVFKNSKTGKADVMGHEEVVRAYWRRVARDYQLKLVSKSGNVLRFSGFKENEYHNLKRFLQERYDVELEDQQFSTYGWNWGKSDFKGDELSFDVADKTAFEIPLINVSQCTQQKDEVTLEFHQNDDQEHVALMEMRFYVPPNQEDETDRVQDFYKKVMEKADVLQVKGNAICQFQDIKFLTPRGLYDIRMYPKFIQLHGKTYDYKITYSSILRLFLLPKDDRQLFFVVSVDPPLKQGQTRYHYLIMGFNRDDELSVDLQLDDDKMREKLEGVEGDGTSFEVVSRVVKAMCGKKITTTGKFKGAGQTSSITCSYKANSGILYPLPRAFMYVVKPPIHIRFDEIAYVNFARGSVSVNKNFDFEVETKNKQLYTFSTIEKSQYDSLFRFCKDKGLRIKGAGNVEEAFDDGVDSDEEHDHYLERMKQEGQNAMGGDDSESDDEDFAPTMEEEGDVKEEFDSEAETSESEIDSDDEEAKRRREKERRRKEKRRKKIAEREKEQSEEEEVEEEDEEEEEPRPKKVKKQDRVKVEKEGKKKKDPNAPKRPSTPYFLWMNENRVQLKEDNPSLSHKDLLKLAGQEWQELDADKKAVYEAQYKREMKVWKVKNEEYQKSDAAASFSATSGGGGKKTVVKDPNAPKRPQTPYFQWLAVNRAELKRENPEVSNKDLLKLAGQAWQALDEDEKSVYEQKYKEEQEKYREKLADYQQTDEYKQHLQNKKAAKKTTKPENNNSKMKKSSGKSSSSKSSSSVSKSSSQVYKSRETIEDSGSSSDSDAPSKEPEPMEHSGIKREKVEVPDEEEMMTESEASAPSSSDSD